MRHYNDTDIFRIARYVLAAHTTLPHSPSIDTVDAAGRLLLAYDRKRAKEKTRLLYRLGRVWRKRRESSPDAVKLTKTSKRPITKKGIDAPGGARY